MDPDPKKQRRAPRAQIRLPLRLWLPEAATYVESVAMNFSRSGMFIALTDMPAAGSRMQTQVVLPDGKQVLQAPDKPQLSGISNHGSVNTDQQSGITNSVQENAGSGHYDQ